MKFQFRWHHYCSALLLVGSYQLSAIKLEASSCYLINEARKTWLAFCEENGVPVPERNPVMMTITSAVYQFLLQYVENFQNGLHNIVEDSSSPLPTSQPAADGDDVYYRFGGAAICDMLHLRYKQLKTCTDDKRDVISQEVTLLQAINSKDKTKIPGYLRYHDKGFMYFPDSIFLPFLRKIDTLVKGIANLNTFKQEGDNLIKV